MSWSYSKKILKHFELNEKTKNFLLPLSFNRFLSSVLVFPPSYLDLKKAFNNENIESQNFSKLLEFEESLGLLKYIDFLYSFFFKYANFQSANLSDISTNRCNLNKASINLFGLYLTSIINKDIGKAFNIEPLTSEELASFLKKYSFDNTKDVIKNLINSQVDKDLKNSNYKSDSTFAIMLKNDLFKIIKDDILSLNLEQPLDSRFIGNILLKI